MFPCPQNNSPSCAGGIYKSTFPLPLESELQPVSQAGSPRAEEEEEEEEESDPQKDVLVISISLVQEEMLEKSRMLSIFGGSLIRVPSLILSADFPL